MAAQAGVVDAVVEKIPSGISGLDQITDGGLPKGRSTLICGGPGSGKTIFAIEFFVRGAELGESGVFIAFEESVVDLTRNVASLGFDLALASREKTGRRLHPPRPERNRGTGWSFAGRALRAFGACGHERGRQARRDRHAGNAVPKRMSK